jgi:hypothetical protein
MHGIRPQIVRRTAFWLLLGGLCGSISCSQEKPKEDQRGPIKVMAVPGACSDDYSNCDNTNSCSTKGSACTIQVDIDTSNYSATATLQNMSPGPKKQPYICIQSGTNVTWVAAKSGQQFSGDFGANSPWTSGKAYVAGNSIGAGTPGKGADQEIANNVSGGTTKCYKYDLIVCPTTCNTANCNLQCGVHDPTVIIGGDPPGSKGSAAQ